MYCDSSNIWERLNLRSEAENKALEETEREVLEAWKIERKTLWIWLCKMDKYVKIKRLIKQAS